MAAPSLLSLPDELLAHIVDLTGELDYEDEADDNPADALELSLTCRRLGQIAQTWLFSNAMIFKPVSLCTLVNTLHSHPALRLKVTRLCIRYSKMRDDDDDIYGDHDYGSEPEDERDEGPQDPSRAIYECALASLFSSPLPALTSLSLKGFPQRLTFQAVRQAGAAGILPNLDTLILGDLGRQAAGISGAEMWELLAAFPTLSHVTLDMEGVRFPTTHDSLVELPSLRSLTIAPVGKTKYETDALADAVALADTVPLADFLPNLISLKMIGYWDLEPCEHAIATVAASLKYLALPRTSDVMSLEDRLARLSSLEELRVEGRLDLPEAFPSLQHTRLTKLVVNCHDIELSDDLLYDLVTKLPHLRRADLNHMGDADPHLNYRAPTGAALARSIEHELTAAGSRGFDAHRQLYSTRRPRWTNGASREGYALALEVAAERGIRVTGETLRCIEWDAVFECEFERQLVGHAVKTNAFSLLVDRYGRQGAIAALQRHSPVLFDLISGAGQDAAVGAGRPQSDRSAE